MMKANENNFVDLIRKRREEGIFYVIENYGELLHSIIRKRLFMAPDRIEKCMNDVFLGIWKNIDSFDESRGSFRNWAAGVARLEAIDALRKIQGESRVRTAPPGGAEIVREDEAIPELAGQEFSGETQEILKGLNEEDQELFRRMFLKAEEPAEADDESGTGRDNVYVRFFRGKQEIQRKIKERKRACV